MKVLIVNKSSGNIVGAYEASAPNQANYGGEWGDASQYSHIQLPDDVDHECAEAVIAEDGSITLDENSDLKQAKRDRTLSQLRDLRNLKLDEVDVMINELVLGERSDTAAVSTYRDALKAITDSYKKIDGHAKAAIDSLDLEAVAWPTKPA